MEAPVPRLYAGFDPGNDSPKLVLPGREALDIPNVIRELDGPPSRVTVRGMAARPAGPDNLVVRLRQTVMLRSGEQFPGLEGYFAVGARAVEERGAPRDQGLSKAGSRHTAVTGVSLLAWALREYAGQPGPPVSVALGAGLPMEEYKDPEKVRALRKALRGRWQVTLHGPEDTTVAFALLDLEVFPEGAGAAMDVLFDAHYRLVRPDLARGWLVVLDLGAFTLDVAVLRDRQLEADRCEGLPLGIAEELDAIAREASKLAGFMVSRAEVVGALVHGQGRLATGADIGPVARPVLRDFAQRVAVQVRHYLRTYRGASFLVVGGGAQVIRPDLEALLGPGAVEFPADGNWRFRNASGYAKLAHLLFAEPVAP